MGFYAVLPGNGALPRQLAHELQHEVAAGVGQPGEGPQQLQLVRPVFGLGQLAVHIEQVAQANIESLGDGTQRGQGESPVPGLPPGERHRLDADGFGQTLLRVPASSSGAGHSLADVAQQLLVSCPGHGVLARTVEDHGGDDHAQKGQSDDLITILFGLKMRRWRWAMMRSGVRTTWTRVLVPMATWVLGTGCMGIIEHRRNWDVPVRMTSFNEVIAESRFWGDWVASKSGSTAVRVWAEDTCVLKKVEVLKRTTVVERMVKNTETHLGYGAGTLGLGAGLLAWAPYLSDEPGKNDEGEETVSPRTLISAFGWTFIGLAGVSAIWATVVGIKSIDGEEPGGEVPRPLPAEEEPCNAREVAARRVSVRYRGTGALIATGATDNEGMITLNGNALDDAIIRDEQDGGAFVTVYIGETKKSFDVPVPEESLAALEVKREQFRRSVEEERARAAKEAERREAAEAERRTRADAKEQARLERRSLVEDFLASVLVPGSSLMEYVVVTQFNAREPCTRRYTNRAGNEADRRAICAAWKRGLRGRSATFRRTAIRAYCSETFPESFYNDPCGIRGFEVTEQQCVSTVSRMCGW